MNFTWSSARRQSPPPAPQFFDVSGEPDDDSLFDGPDKTFAAGLRGGTPEHRFFLGHEYSSITCTFFPEIVLAPSARLS